VTFTIDPIWKDQRVVIIAGGETVTSAVVRQIAMARLEGRCRVIAVNDAIYIAWFADWLHGADFKWWSRHIHRVQHFKGIKTTIADQVPEAWAHRLECTGREGFDENPGNCRSGNNSGFQALHCAIHTGADRIVLVGFDMAGGHWFEGHPGEPETDRTVTMAPAFTSLKPAIEKRGITILNASPRSELHTYPMVPLADALR
jgi:hypothetical protein